MPVRAHRPTCVRQHEGLEPGGRLTAGLAVGNRRDDFVADGYGTSGRGARLDRDLEAFREIWQGKPVDGGSNPAVPEGTRQIPILFGGFTPAALDWMARWGEGYIGGSVPAPLVAPAFGAARDAWRRAGREGSPRLVALAYYALGDSNAGKRNIYDFYRVVGDEFAKIVVGAFCDCAAAVRAVVDLDSAASDFLSQALEARRWMLNAHSSRVMA